MKNIAHYLLEVAQSKFWDPKEWRAWADNVLLKSTDPDFWIIEVSLAKNLDELWKALGDKYIEERSRNGATLGLSEGIIGYYYLKFESKIISLQEFLLLAGEEADAGETKVTCESIYRICNQLINALENGYFDNQLGSDLLGKTKTLLHDYKLIAKDHLTAIDTFT